MTFFQRLRAKPRHGRPEDRSGKQAFGKWREAEERSNGTSISHETWVQGTAMTAMTAMTALINRSWCKSNITVQPGFVSESILDLYTLIACENVRTSSQDYRQLVPESDVFVSDDIRKCRYPSQCIKRCHDHLAQPPSLTRKSLLSECCKQRSDMHIL